MKFVIFSAMLLAVLSVAAGGKSYGGLFKHPSNPGKCTLDSNLVLEPGETIKNPHGECALLSCHENGLAVVLGCVKQGMREGCTEGEVLHPHSRYPLCCKREITCDRYYYSDNF